jgi:molecular chaperone HtpG
LYGKLERRNCVVEFKFDLAGLFRDFSDEKKMFDEINLVVAWDISERDRKLVANRGLTLSAIETGILNPGARRFPEAQWKLNIDGVRSIDVLCIKKLLKPGA